jgi:hypothetical protein
MNPHGVRQKRCSDDEDDQEHEHDVHEGGHVDLADDVLGVALGLDGH